MVTAALVVAKDEHLVLHDRTTGREAKLVVYGVGLRVGEHLAGLRVLISMKRENAAVELVGSGTQRDVDHGSARVSELGIEVRRGNVNRLNCLCRWHQRGQVAVIDLVLDALDLEVVVLTSLPVDTDGQRVLRVVELRVWPRQSADTRHQRHQPLVVAVEQQRQLLQLPRLDLHARVGPVGLQDRGRSRDGDRLGHRTRRKFQIDPDRRVRRQADVTANGGVKAVQCDLGLIGARVEIREHVQAALVRLALTGHARVRFSQDHRRPGDDTPGRIRDGPEDLSFQDLCAGARRGHDREYSQRENVCQAAHSL